MSWGEDVAVVLDADTAPVWWPNLYLSVVLRDGGRAFATQRRAAAAIVQAHAWADAAGVDLADRIRSLEFLGTDEVAAIRSWLREDVAVRAGRTPPRHGTVRVVCNRTWIERCRSVAAYVRWCGGHALQRLVRGSPIYVEAAMRLDAFITQMNELLPPAGTVAREGFDEAETVAILEASLPGSAGNPFEAKHQQRNFLIVFLLYELGLRLGELRGIKRHDLMLAGSRPVITIHRRDNDPDDTRRRKAKTKTAARTLPLSRASAFALNNWLTKERLDPAIYPGAKRNPYVFVSERGLPIAEETIHAIFRRLRTAPDVPDGFVPHLLRHTWNDRFSEMADAEQLRPGIEEQTRRFLMGWSKTSNQGEHYTQRHIREQGAAYLRKLQELSFSGSSRS